MSNKIWKLDKSKMSVRCHQDTDHQYEYWQSKTIKERLEAAYYLNSVAYNFDINHPPRMDKSVFSVRKRP